MEYLVKQEDIVGDIEGFPIEVVHVMCERQLEQTGKVDPSVFASDKSASSNEGGFHWGSTIEGDEFWCNVIIDKDWKAFYDRFANGLAGDYVKVRLRNVAPSKKLSSMTKAEKWLFSNMETKGASMYERVSDLVVHLNSYPDSIDVVIRKGICDGIYMPLPKNVDEVHELLTGQKARTGTNPHVVFQKTAILLESYIYELKRFYESVLFGGEIDRELVPMYGTPDVKKVIGWIKKNIGVAVRFYKVRMRFFGTDYEVTALTEDQCDKLVFRLDPTTHVLVCGDVFVVDGVAFRIAKR